MKSNAVNETTRYAVPKSLEEALRILADGGRTVIAGGTDVYPAAGATIPSGSFVDLSSVDELRGITKVGGHHRIGALATWTEIANAGRLPGSFHALRRAAGEVGSVQIQNVATIGGNLVNASPAADGVPPLLVLGALVELTSVRGSRVLPIEEFLVGYRATALDDDEILTAVLVPDDHDGASSVFIKLGSRSHLVISIVMVAVLLDTAPDGTVMTAKVAVGACSPVATRLHALESELIGRNTAESLEMVPRPEHLAPLSPIDDVRATAAYRTGAAFTLIERGLADAGGLR